MSSALVHKDAKETRPVDVSRPIPKIRVNYFGSLKKIVDQIGDAFENIGEVLEVAGLPIRVFGFRDLRHLEAIFKDPKVSGTKYPKLLPRLQWAMPKSGVILPGGEEWKWRRRQAQTAFKSEWLVRYTNMVPPLTAQMLDGWSRYEKSGEAFDISRDLQNLIMRLIFRMYFSTELTADEISSYSKMAHYIEDNLGGRTPLWVPTPSTLRFRKYVTAWRKKIRELIAERRANPAGKDDLLTVMIDARDPATDEMRPDEDLVAEILNVCWATSLLSTSLSWAFYLIATHSEVQQRLIDEAHLVLGERRPNDADLDNLSYTAMAFDEVIRLYPSAWCLPRYCEDGMCFDGYKIPSKSLVVAMHYHTMRHPAYWSQPEEFQPDRFNAENSKRIHPFAYLPYSKGERSCLGIHLAPMVTQLVIAMVHQRFKLTYHPQSSEDPVANFGFEIHPRDPMMMSIRRSA